MMCDVLPHLTALSCAMQKQDAVYTTIKPLVFGTISIIQGMKLKSAEHYETAPARVAQLIEQGFNIKSPSEDQLATFHEKFYLPFLDNIVHNLTDRFPDLPLLEKFGTFAVTSSEDNNDQDLVEIKELASHFGLDSEQCSSNWHQVKASLEGSDHSADQTMAWIKSNLASSHPALYALAAVGLLLPTSTADCERGFSCMKRVTTENRNRLSVKVLNSLLAVSLQGPPIEVFNFEKAVKVWKENKPRRHALTK